MQTNTELFTGEASINGSSDAAEAEDTSILGTRYRLEKQRSRLTDWQDTAFQDGFNTDADFPG
jgi:hypothetical protein